METTAPLERPQSWSELFAFAKRAGEAFIGRTHQWVAGERMEDALLAARQTNARGMEAILNYRGERLQDRAQVEATAREYLRLLVAMESEGIRGAVRLKPTQFGLMIVLDLALFQVIAVLDAAK